MKTIKTVEDMAEALGIPKESLGKGPFCACDKCEKCYEGYIEQAFNEKFPPPKPEDFVTGWIFKKKGDK